MYLQVNDHISIGAETYETRYSWGHKAHPYRDNQLIDKRKITYYNRTWERFQFETILQSLADSKKLSRSESEELHLFIKNLN